MEEIYHPGKEAIVSVENISLKTYLIPNKDTGEQELHSYVSFKVIGKYTEFEDFILLPEFQLHNPMVPLMTDNN